MITTQNWEIGNCLDLLPSIKDKSIQMILTDLPYGTTACPWDSIIPFKPLWKEYKRIIKDNGAIVLTANQPFTTDLINSNREMFKYCIIWEKSRVSGFTNAKNKPLNTYEDICIFSMGDCANGSKNKMLYCPQGLKGYNKIQSGTRKIDNDHKLYRKNNEKLYTQEFTNYPKNVIKIQSETNPLHPTQKPVKLFEYLIKTYTNEGNTVHDSCLGSGTTLEACRNTNRNCIGFEISNEWESHYDKRSMKNIPQLSNWF